MGRRKKMAKKVKKAQNDEARRLAAEFTSELSEAIPLLVELLCPTHVLNDEQYVKTLKSTLKKNSDYWEYYYILRDMHFQRELDYWPLIADLQRLFFQNVKAIVASIVQDGSTICGWEETSTGSIHKAWFRNDTSAGFLQRILCPYFELNSSENDTTIKSKLRIENTIETKEEGHKVVIEELMLNCVSYEATREALGMQSKCALENDEPLPKRARIATRELTESKESEDERFVVADEHRDTQDEDEATGGEPKEPEATAGEPKEPEASAENDDPDSSDGENDLCCDCRGYLYCDRNGMCAGCGADTGCWDGDSKACWHSKDCHVCAYGRTQVCNGCGMHQGCLRCCPHVPDAEAQNDDQKRKRQEALEEMDGCMA